MSAWIGRLIAVDERHGPLPVLLLGLTVLTGLVDAVSYLRLSHVFVANMTGNVVFLGFAAAGVKDFSVPSSLAAIASFLAGAGMGGVLSRRNPRHRGYLFWLAMTGEMALIIVALVASLMIVDLGDAVLHFGLIISLGLMMGLQNAIVRRLGVPDLTTTVLTLTLTGLAADAAGGNRLRRIASVAAMFSGAVIGAVLVLKVNVPAVLAVALALLAMIAVIAFCGQNSDRAWAAPA